MSNNSGKSSAKQSSNGSAAQFIKGVQQLIDSDQEEKYAKRLAQLRMEFPILRRIHSYMSNAQKLQTFLRDNHFKHKANEKINQKGLICGSMPIIKAYLSSTRYQATILEQFDENDLLNTFSRFGQINYLVVNSQIAYISYHFFLSAYISMKVMNQFQISEHIRLTVRWCNLEENNIAQSLFIKNQTQLNNEDAGGTISLISIPFPNEKYVAKYEINAESLPEFNIAQRIIGPKGSFMKKILEKVMNAQSSSSKYTMQNIEKLVKMRLRGKNSGFIESSLGKESDEKMHLCLSSKQKSLYDIAAKQIDKLFLKIFQEYKFSYQKAYSRHPEGLAYRVLESQANYFTQIREVYMEEIQSLDILSLSKQAKLTPKQIEDKISERDKARKMGLYKEADEIRNWLKQRGVLLVDQKGMKGKGKATTWNYI